MSNDFCELVLTCDTREKDSTRVKAISDFFADAGAIVQNEKLERCDYHIEGLFKDVAVNLGLENKVLLGDFFPSLETMPEKFVESYQYFDDVALFVEEGNYDLKVTDDGMDAWILNPAMQAASGLEGVGTLAMYNNFMASMAASGIHVRSYRTVAHFPLTVSGLLKSIVKPVHRGIAVNNPEKNFHKDMVNLFVKLPGVGAKTAEKGLLYIPNLERFNTLSLTDLRDIFGYVQGAKLYSFISNKSRIDECAERWKELQVKVAPKHKKEIDDQIKKNKKAVQNALERMKSPDGMVSHEEPKENAGDQTVVDPVHKEVPQSPGSEDQTTKKYEKLIVEEKDILPRPKDVVEYIRKKPRSLKEVGDYFSFSPEYCMKTLYEFQEKKKIWFDRSTNKWTFGRSQEPAPVVAQEEFDIGV